MCAAFARQRWVLRSWATSQRFRGGLVFKAHRLVYHPTLGWRVIKKKKKTTFGDRLRVGWFNGFYGRGATRAEDAQATPTQSHIPPSILVYEDKNQGTRKEFAPTLRAGGKGASEASPHSQKCEAVPRRARI